MTNDEFGLITRSNDLIWYYQPYRFSVKDWREFLSQFQEYLYPVVNHTLYTRIHFPGWLRHARSRFLYLEKTQRNLNSSTTVVPSTFPSLFFLSIILNDAL